jgi:hypothetical protein
MFHLKLLFNPEGTAIPIAALNILLIEVRSGNDIFISSEVQGGGNCSRTTKPMIGSICSPAELKTVRSVVNLHLQAICSGRLFRQSTVGDCFVENYLAINYTVSNR